MDINETQMEGIKPRRGEEIKRARNAAKYKITLCYVRKKGMKAKRGTKTREIKEKTIGGKNI